MSMMLEGFPVGEIDGVMRRTLWTSAGLGILAVGGGIGFGYPLFGVGAVLGLALALANSRFFQVSAARHTTSAGRIRRVPFAGATLVRLGAVTVVALVLMFFVRSMGWGVLGGLVLFQMTMLVSMLRVLLAYQRGEASGGSGA